MFGAVNKEPVKPANNAIIILIINLTAVFTINEF